MNALLAASSLALGLCIYFVVPNEGGPALFLGGALALLAGVLISRVKGEDKKFLMQIYVAGLLLRVALGTAIFVLRLQEFFGGDAFTYDTLGLLTLKTWYGDTMFKAILAQYNIGWGMAYMVAAVYWLLGRNMLAVQFVNAVFGAATAPVIFLCARHIFENTRVSRWSALFVAFYPSLVLWSSQGLKDGPLVFLLALSIWATLNLLEKIQLKYIFMLGVALLGIISFRFYVFYMMVAAIGGAFVLGMTKLTAQTLVRQVVIIIGLGLAMTQFGVLDTASDKLDMQKLQVSRADLAASAQSGFGRDVDVSTTSGALSTIPVGLVYLLFAPFPWQLASLRQSITLPEMVVWWASFPMLVTGLWFTLRYRVRQALPILLFTTMLTLAYSVFQGNVGTAYRQRSQLLIFYFIFASVGYELLRERREDKKREVLMSKRHTAMAAARGQARRAKQREWEKIADDLTEKIGF